ncbi:hypothetical protein [Streptomyces scopuliridis]|uniref:hypothetical protein n=1 Tax=Streptomyces scopuliridis TaxID=452529 RepID=UPI0035DE063E
MEDQSRALPAPSGFSVRMRGVGADLMTHLIAWALDLIDRRESKRNRAPDDLNERVEWNVQRILNPPKPSLLSRFGACLIAAEEWWERNVSFRDFHRRMDAVREAYERTSPPGWKTEEGTRRALRRLAHDAETRKRQADEGGT